MEATDAARTILTSEQEEKVAQIFAKFDEDKDGVLRKVYSGSATTFFAPPSFHASASAPQSSLVGY